MSDAEEYLKQKASTSTEVSNMAYYVWVRHKHALEAVRLARKESYLLGLNEKLESGTIEDLTNIVHGRLPINWRGNKEVVKLVRSQKQETTKEILEELAFLVVVNDLNARNDLFNKAKKRFLSKLQINNKEVKK